MAEIEFDDVVKRYPDGFEAVKHMNLEIRDGEFVILVGPSGCGKSTALRMIAGLEDISEGELKIGGEVVNDLAPKDRDIAMVFQNYALYPHMSVRDNMGFALKLRKEKPEEINRRVNEAAKTLDLEPHLDRKPANLSGGQRQRVAVGRAIVREPQVFLMDEPLSNLDAKLRAQTRSEIRRLQREIGTTTVYVTHDQVEAMTMGHRVAVMRDGVLQQVDAPERIYDAPINLFVASFVGSPAMNLLEAEVAREGDRVVCRLGETSFTAPASLARRAGGRVAVGLRPEYIHPAFGGGDGIRLRGLVRLVEPLGSEVLAHVEVPAAALSRPDLVDAAGQPEEGFAAAGLGSATVLARFDRELAVRADEPIELAIDSRRLLFFDLETGAAVPAADVPVAATVAG